MDYIIVIFFAGILTVRGISVKYNIESHTANGDLCMNNCVNNKCITGPDRQEKFCREGDVTAPVFYTAQKTGQRKHCLSRCAKFAVNYEWCYTTENFDWDYCSSEKISPWDIVMKRRFTKAWGPCKTYCNRDPDGVNRCVSFWGDVVECGMEGYSYVQAKTATGLRCNGLCAKHGGTSYYWCYDTNRQWDYCALPARARLFYSKRF